MKYERMEPAVFLERLNRFTALIKLRTGEPAVCHVKNTGRCKELFISGTSVYVQKAVNPDRKTKYDLICVEKTGRLVNVDSQAPNEVAAEWIRTGHLFSQTAKIQKEVRHGQSRFDLYIEEGERKAFIEVKGVTLEQDGIGRFPDAPTQRGIKHIEELISCFQEGYEAYLLFVVQMKGVRFVMPNDAAHPAFGAALRRAAAAGVRILAVDCQVTADTLIIDEKIPVCFS